jgi:FKBP-type peptidyl-prolyl cis-trans isomerase
MSGGTEGPPTLPPGRVAQRAASGLETIDVIPGEGAAARSGQRVRVRYRMWLLDGTLVVETGEGSPQAFVPGEGRVIAALEEGVIGMRPGGVRRLIAPSDLAYGPRGQGRQIPPYATVILDLTLVSVG